MRPAWPSAPNRTSAAPCRKMTVRQCSFRRTRRPPGGRLSVNAVEVAKLHTRGIRSRGASEHNGSPRRGATSHRQTSKRCKWHAGTQRSFLDNATQDGRQVCTEATRLHSFIHKSDNLQDPNGQSRSTAPHSQNFVKTQTDSPAPLREVPHPSNEGLALQARV